MPESNLELLQHALALARAGWPVFPIWHCVDGVCACGKPKRGQIGKHPRCWHGHNDATTDEAQIRVWWSDGVDAPPGFAWECSPLSNIGLAVPDGVVIVDIDPRNGGLDTAAELEALDGGLPTTRTVASSNGGCHLYYSVPEGTAYPKTAGAGVDLKQLGGYVLAPPSIHKSGQCYALEVDAPIADAPAWLIKLGFERKEKTARKRERKDHDDALSPATLKEADALIAILEPCYVEGSRHAIARAFGGYAKKNGKSAALVEYVVSQLPSEDVDMRVESALTYYDYDNPTGWAELKEHLPPDVSKQLEGIVKAKRQSAGLGLALRRAQHDARVASGELEADGGAAANTTANAGARVEGGNPLDAWALPDEGGDIAPLDYVCEKYGIAEGKVVAIGGYAGSGKSPLGLLLAACVANGKPFLGAPTSARPVVFCCYEGHRLTLIRRQRICRSLDVVDTSVNVRRPMTGFTEESLLIIRDTALWLRDTHGKPALFIHDTYTSANRGADQNSAEYADALWALGDIGDETGAVNVVLTHFKKSKDDESDLQMLSGHNAIASATQAVLGLVQNRKKPEEITVHPTRVPEAPFKPQTILWSDQAKPDVAPNHLLRTHLWGLKCELLEGPTKEADPAEAIAQTMLEAIGRAHAGLTREDAIASSGRDVKLARPAFASLVANGIIVSDKVGLKILYKKKGN